jgi:pimeloyl-ACP methyl ester carboxylesterase
MLVAGRDTIIPAAHAERLYGRWPGPKRWVEFPGATHDTISDEPGYWRATAAFLEELK